MNERAKPKRMIEEQVPAKKARPPRASPRRAYHESQRWLQSEQAVLADLMYQERTRSQVAVLSPVAMTKAYNLKMKGVVQLAGEITVICTILKKQRVAPIRSQHGVRGMMPKCEALSHQQPREDDME
ncbi:hypothetical protein IFR05_015208 [Cadophora sp. M221]|nr:hypothetical protein IFR05_015208 [Cadophora sp. M221]